MISVILITQEICHPSHPAILERQTSHTTKVYEEGTFHDGQINNISSSNSPMKSDGQVDIKPVNGGLLDHGYQSGSGRLSTSTLSPSGFTLGVYISITSN